MKTGYNPYFLHCTLNFPRSAENTAYIKASLVVRKFKKGLSTNPQIALVRHLRKQTSLSFSSVERDLNFLCPKSVDNYYKCTLDS